MYRAYFRFDRARFCRRQPLHQWPWRQSSPSFLAKRNYGEKGTTVEQFVRSDYFRKLNRHQEARVIADRIVRIPCRCGKSSIKGISGEVDLFPLTSTFSCSTCGRKGTFLGVELLFQEGVFVVAGGSSKLRPLGSQKVKAGLPGAVEKNVSGDGSSQHSLLSGSPWKEDTETDPASFNFQTVPLRFDSGHQYDDIFQPLMRYLQKMDQITDGFGPSHASVLFTGGNDEADEGVYVSIATSEFEQPRSRSSSKSSRTASGDGFPIDLSPGVKLFLRPELQRVEKDKDICFYGFVIHNGQYSDGNVTIQVPEPVSGGQNIKEFSSFYFGEEENQQIFRMKSSLKEFKAMSKLMESSLLLEEEEEEEEKEEKSEKKAKKRAKKGKKEKKKGAMSLALFCSLLGQELPPPIAKTFTAAQPSSSSWLQKPHISVLNESQKAALQAVFEQPLTLIQGPPGTGKTRTAAALVVEMISLLKTDKQKVLVCASSNVAADNLTERLLELNCRVIRVYAAMHESYAPTESKVQSVAVHRLARKFTKNAELIWLFGQLELGIQLTPEDYQKMRRLKKRECKKILKQKCEVIVTTCMSAADSRLSSLQFPFVVIDEATQCLEVESLIPLVNGAQRAVLIGDHCQLGPVDVDNQLKETFHDRSIFERLVLAGQPTYMLNTQYRMHPVISVFSNRVFYNSNLEDGITAEERRSFFQWPVKDTPLLFLATKGQEEMSQRRRSFSNQFEADVVGNVVRWLLRGGITPDGIGVITPYSDQRKLIYGQLRDMEMNLSTLEVASVDEFQGREKDYIIISCVRDNESNVIGFLREERRLNVALTRARYGLILIGNPKILSKNVLWRELCCHFSQMGCLLTGQDLQNLQQYPFHKNPTGYKYSLKRALPNELENLSRASESVGVSTQAASN